MIVSPISRNAVNHKQKSYNFSGSTVFEPQKIIEKDILTLEESKDLFHNYSNPNQDLIGVKLRRYGGSVDIYSRYGHLIGDIEFNKQALHPEVNLHVGSFQPVIELDDEELGVKVLMMRGSKIKGKDLNIDYKELTKPNVSFGHKLVVTTGYKGAQLEQLTNNYFADNIKHSSDLKQQYTFIGLGSGYGTRLKPISDLYGTGKPATKYPGEEKTLYQVAVLDAVNNVGDIDKVQFIREPENSLSGTAGVIIKGLKDGTIPKDKPLVLMTGDIFHNIDLEKALKIYEQDDNCGIAVLVKDLDTYENLYGKSLVKLASTDFNTQISDIRDFSPKLDGSNMWERNDYASCTDTLHYYTSTNIMIIHPKVLQVLEKFAGYNGEADFLEFLGVMFNVMNKPSESLLHKYPNGINGSHGLLGEMTDYLGYPKTICSDGGKTLTVKAIVARDKNDENPIWEDAGTVEDYMKSVRLSQRNPLTKFDFFKTLRNYIDNNDVIYMNKAAKDKISQFKTKYNISELSGNVIVFANDKVKKQPVLQAAQSPITKTQSAIGKEQTFVLLAKINKLPEAQKYIQQLIKQHGLSNFMTWYFNTYYPEYEKYVNNYFAGAGSIEELLKFQPNWAPWKLEEKKWLLENPQYRYSTFEEKRTHLNNYWDSIREIPFEIGSVPWELGGIYYYRNLINKLKTEDIKNMEMDIAGRNIKIKRLKGGEYNNKFVYLLDANYRKFILKFERTNVEDANHIDGRDLSMFEKKNIRKEKYLASDSVYSNACISKYLELNGCNNIPKLLYYNHQTHSSLYEYVEDVNGDEFQKDLIDEEYMSLDKMNNMFENINALGVYLNDTAYKNILTDKNGIKKIIDLGHANFMHPLKPGVKRLNIEFANTNGPDLRSIFASFMLSALQNTA